MTNVTGPASQAVQIRVPATSANLGPGYDSFGLALGIFDEVTARRAGSGLSVTIHGVGAGALPTDETHLVVQAAIRAFDRMREPVPGLALECVNAIPHGSGQGSSAAAIVAGVLLARALTPEGSVRLPDAAVLALATEMEGHPDNVAPALMGGFTIAWQSAAGPPDADVRAVRLDPHPAVRAVLLGTDRACATSQARAALPARVPHADAAVNAARAGLLVHALTRDPDLLWEATEDRLHQQYRAAIMPESLRLLQRLRDAGIAAVLSGAGPTVLALGTALPPPEALQYEDFHARAVDLAAGGAQLVLR